MRWIIIGLVILAGCASTSEPLELVETLTVSEECTNAEACCESDCMKFCQESGIPYTKHYLNEPHCACWCG